MCVCVCVRERERERENETRQKSLDKRDSPLFYHLEFSDYCLRLRYTHSVEADMSFGLLRVFHVEIPLDFSRKHFSTKTPRRFNPNYR